MVPLVPPVPVGEPIRPATPEELKTLQEKKERLLQLRDILLNGGIDWEAPQMVRTGQQIKVIEEIQKGLPCPDSIIRQMLQESSSLLGARIIIPNAPPAPQPPTPPGMMPAMAVPQPNPAGQRAGMKPWSSYFIAPPDILNVQVVNYIPKSPCLLKVFDIISIDATGVSPDFPISGAFCIEPGGVVQLGFEYGSVKIEGLSVEQAKEAISKHLTNFWEKRTVYPVDPDLVVKPAPVGVTVRLARMGEMQQVNGQHAVGPDGYITLGSYGRVYVHGLTVPECQQGIEFHLSQFLEQPRVVVEVHASNSKNYYVIVRSNGERTKGDQILRFPCTGDDTVLGALTNMAGLVSSSDCVIKHIRPGEGGEPLIRLLSWEKVLFSKSGFGDKVQILPEDRIVLEMK
jgi:polysaccharide export outer membrane protein